MQIIITQVEIEQAITSYIHEQINVREGMKVDIDLAATRGQGGFTATINIVANTPKPAINVKSASAGAVTKTKVADTGTGVGATEPKPEQKQAVVAEEISPQEEATKSETGGKRSLFGNLTKPVNS